MEILKCEHTGDPSNPCQKGMACYINAPDYYNCFMVYKYFLNGNTHTLQEVAELMNISHTTVKCIEDQALEKLREDAENNKEMFKVVGETPGD